MESVRDLLNIMQADEPNRVKSLILDEHIKKMIIVSDVGCVLKFEKEDWYSVTFVTLRPGLNVLCLCKIRAKCELWQQLPYQMTVTVHNYFDEQSNLTVPQDFLDHMFFTVENTSVNVHTMGLYVNYYIASPPRLDFMLLKKFSMLAHSQQLLGDIFRGRIPRYISKKFGLSKIQEFILDTSFYEILEIFDRKDSICHYLFGDIGHSFGCGPDDVWLDQTKKTMKRFFVILSEFRHLEPRFMEITRDIDESDAEDMLNRNLFYLDNNCNTSSSWE